MNEQQYKHKNGDIIETSAGTFGKVISAKVVYEIQFSANDIQLVDEDVITTEPKQKRTRKKKLPDPAE